MTSARAQLAAVFPAAWEMHRNDYGRDVIRFIGGVFAGLAVLPSVHQILQHLIHYWQAAEARGPHPGHGAHRHQRLVRSRFKQVTSTSTSAATATRPSSSTAS